MLLEHPEILEMFLEQVGGRTTTTRAARIRTRTARIHPCAASIRARASHIHHTLVHHTYTTHSHNTHTHSHHTHTHIHTHTPSNRVAHFLRLRLCSCSRFCGPTQPSCCSI
jgi:hypothetical protein